MFKQIDNGLYRFTLSVRVPGLDTPRRRVLVEPCANDAEAEKMAQVLKERVRADFQHPSPSRTLEGAVEDYRKKATDIGAEIALVAQVLVKAWARLERAEKDIEGLVVSIGEMVHLGKG